MNNMAALIGALGRTKVVPDVISLFGGLDEVTPPYKRKPGVARAALNYEASIDGGYRRIAGYERMDGQAKPSDAQYGVMDVTVTGSVSVGDTITGVTSAATAVVLAVVTTVSPTYLVLTKIVGTFVAAETLNVSGSPEATSITDVTVDGASTPLLAATYKALAANNYRADIDAIPGSGNVLGVFEFEDVRYGFRNNAGGTAAALYKTSTGGWTAVALGRELSFTSGGVTEIAEGDTITGATSAATAVITRVVLTSGSWAAGTAAGKFIFASQTGTFQAENLNVGASLNLATIAGDSTAITLQPSGRFVFKVENFGGATGTNRVYGCDGENRGFEFDGTVFVPIDTGMAVDTPNRVYVHKKQLFFSFGASVQHSAPGTPYIWNAVLGASEIALGDDVTGFSAQPGASGGSGALAIFTRNRVAILYGSGVADWNLSTYREELGAYAHTVQDVGYSIYLDDRGITDLQTSQAYGNFAHNAISNQIKDRINGLRTTAQSSCISRDKSQYRLFFSGGDAIYVTLAGRKLVGIMPMLFPDAVLCVWSGERLDGSEATYFGSADGYVYEMDKGSSFDGEEIESYINLAYNFQNSPRTNKHYRDCTVEVDGSSYVGFNFGYSLGYGSTLIPQPDDQAVVTNLSSVYWDTFTWDQFTWDGTTLSPNCVTVDGDAENISLSIQSSSAIYETYSITSMLLNYTPRGRLRP